MLALDASLTFHERLFSALGLLTVKDYILFQNKFFCYFGFQRRSLVAKEKGSHLW